MSILTIEEIYQEILDGKRKQFPKGTWEDKELAIICIKYLQEEKLQWSIEEIKENVSQDTFKK